MLPPDLTGARAVKRLAPRRSRVSGSLRRSLLILAGLLAVSSTAHAAANRQAVSAQIFFGNVVQERLVTTDGKIHAIQFAQVDASGCEKPSGPCRGVVKYVTEARSGFCRLLTHIFNERATLNFYVYDVQNQKYLSEQEVRAKVKFNEVIMAASPFSMEGLAQVSHDYDPELFGNVCTNENHNPDGSLSTMYEYLNSDNEAFFRSDSGPLSPAGARFVVRKSGRNEVQSDIDLSLSAVDTREFTKTPGGIFRLRGHKDKNKRNGFLRKIYGFYDIHDPYVEMPEDYAATFKAGWKGW